MPPTFPDRRGDNARLDDWFAEEGEVEWGGERDAVPARPRSSELPRVDQAAPTGVPVRANGSQRRAVVRRRRVIALVALVALAGAGVAAGVVLLRSDEPESPPATTASVTTEPAATEPPAPPPPPPAAATQPPPETSTAPLTIELPETGSLAVGARGDAVETLQTALRALGFDPGAGDGVFGEGTREAVRAFQRANDLPADGIVGATTADALNAVLAEQGITG